MNNKRELRELCDLSKQGDEKATLMLIEIFQSQVYKNSYINGKFDEDCFQELNMRLLNCIKKFKIDEDYDIFKCNKIA
ncbi:helix-turn-helix domain-containing protein [Anaerophilus nitritogenes]|uniref:helix-turn-helix domain-containing protein n=1 Tax=Anaerophilus nitritogenes TaxID=2498136 RepID=UPI00101B5B39|nr:helix-turn-helix domain-containing protein [Anaerophilus nitritogenes]